MSSILRLALGQVPPRTGAKVENLHTMDELAAAASDAGADVLILPEMFLTGYVLGRAQTVALAEFANGPSAQKVAAIARDHQVAIIYGYPEEDDAGRIFNTVGFTDSDGVRMLDYRKLHYFGDVDREQFDTQPVDPVQGSTGGATGEGQLSACPVVPWREWRLGVAICYDIEFPEVARGLALHGADIICVPTANMAAYDHVQQILLPARALENQVYLAYANYCGEDSRFRYGGLSCVIGPDGAVQSRAGREEELVICEISRETLAASRLQNPYLRDRRFDLHPRPDDPDWGAPS
ncbi:carbon-nitrogen hydrolase family protein [Nesterenkonia natronophila]|uniref:Carbon-nitrogen hydrolase n=1 Tax=Nesterenkonia natronophila TaxID=2174932 RepID=A0A3A4FCS8_9MICC|nr:carbon-nitrogen hydrolase family protein [Nesterenkonia natronophila]RJN32887.1 carbon-nitrogen hydrolase [Nesterenkonia natronophila]